MEARKLENNNLDFGMEEFKGTKGEWKAVQTDKVENHLDIAINSDKKCICWVYSNSFGSGGKLEHEANAQLIAAAPELLEALQISRKWMLSKGIDIEKKVFKKSESAINKALGK